MTTPVMTTDVMTTPVMTTDVMTIDVMTIDELASASGTTTRRIRALQTLGLIDHPRLRGRTGLYDARHRGQLAAVRRLQGQGFSLESLAVLFAAHRRGEDLGTLLGLPGPDARARSPRQSDPDTAPDVAELYGFSELQAAAPDPGRRGPRQPALSLVPTTVWDESQAS